MARSLRFFAFFGHPLVQFLLVCALVTLNQVLCHAYVLRAHHGDPSFVTRYLGPGWFALEKGPPVRFVAAHVGDGRWLAPTVLRVQAFLELPFTLFAYLAVARMLGGDVFRALLRWPLLALAAVSFTLTFAVVELWLANPWTRDDLVLRALACVVVPPYVARVSRSSADVAAPSGVLGLAAFLAGAGAIAYLVLVAYDALLLYNLAHLHGHAVGVAAATGIASLAAWAAPRVDRVLPGGASPAIVAVRSALATFTVLFFVPSLPIRYGAGHPLAALLGALLVLASAGVGLVVGVRRGGARVALAAPLAVAIGALAASSAFGHGMAELVLARVSLVFLATTTAAFRAAEIVLGGVCWAPHEAKAPADEA